MGRDVNDDRRRALVKGKFKFLYQDDTEDIEATDKFNLAVVQNKLLGPVKYQDKEGKDPEVLKIYGQERNVGEGYSNPDITIPGVLDLFTVVWSNPFGDISVEQDIKLFEFSDIQKYSTYNDGPESKDFCRFFTSSSSRELDGFDSSIFWSSGFLWKHFKTCGVEAWDQQLRELVDHYKNWRAWSHEVHNLSGHATGNSKRFSDNSFSGPSRASTSYSRERERGRGQQNNNTCSSSKVTSPPPSPALLAPPVGQTVLVPVPGHDGNIVHVQLSTVLPGQQQPRYKYINPNIPPPGYQDTLIPHSQTKASWTSQVDEFLFRPGQSANKTVKRKSEGDPTTGDRSKRSNFTPKAQIFAPSPSSRDDVNELDTRPGNTIYVGEISDWRGKFGFLNCSQIPGKIFVHSKDILSGRKGVKAGTKMEFQVLHQESSLVGAKAVNISVRP